MLLASLWRETPQDQLYLAAVAFLQALPYLIVLGIGAWAALRWTRPTR